MKQLLLVFAIVIFFSACREESWCNRQLRPELASLKKVETSSTWFEVFDVGEGVYAVAEPYNFQEVISYLILGEDRALLFDTGLGMASMAELVKELTPLPVVVANSHTHHDHMGSNHEFDKVYTANSPYSFENAKNGYLHEEVEIEVSELSFCQRRLPGFDKSAYAVPPYVPTDTIVNQQIIDLGNRALQFLSIPGHTADGMALYDAENGYLWTGDSFYEGPIYLFDEVTDLLQYQNSVELLARLVPDLNKVFGGHNLPVSQPERLTELKEAIDAIIAGEKEIHQEEESYYSGENAALEFKFEHFSLLIRQSVIPE